MNMRGVLSEPVHVLASRTCRYIIQEYCDAGSLAQAIDRGAFLDERTGRNDMVRRSCISPLFFSYKRSHFRKL